MYIVYTMIMIFENLATDSYRTEIYQRKQNKKMILEMCNPEYYF